MSILLTDEEMAIALKERYLGHPENRIIRARGWVKAHKKEVPHISKAQLKKVIEWLKEENQGPWSDAAEHRDSWFIHPDSMQVLLNEIKRE